MYPTNSSYNEENSILRRVTKIRVNQPKLDISRSWINSQGYYETHFKCELVLEGMDNTFIRYCKSKSKARKAVCEGSYNYLEEHDMLFSIQDEIENPNKAEAVGQLETLARRGYFSLPTYDFEQGYNKNGNPIWKCECYIEEYNIYCDAKLSSKKDTKKSAAFEMLQYVLSEEE